MAEDESQQAHSAVWFGDQRDFWWNADQVELVGRRLGLGGMREVLDVGAGIGHWGRVLALALPTGESGFGWSREEAERYWLAGGGIGEEFAGSWTPRTRETERDSAAVRRGEYHSAGGGILYLVAGRKK